MVAASASLVSLDRSNGRYRTLTCDPQRVELFRKTTPTSANVRSRLRRTVCGESSFRLRLPMSAIVKGVGYSSEAAPVSRLSIQKGDMATTQAAMKRSGIRINGSAYFAAGRP